jgi:hypothetical protein
MEVKFKTYSKTTKYSLKENKACRKIRAAYQQIKVSVTLARLNLRYTAEIKANPTGGQPVARTNIWTFTHKFYHLNFNY